MEKKACNMSMDEIKELASLVAEKKLTKIAIKINDEEIVIESKKEKLFPPAPPMPAQFNAPVSAQSLTPSDECPPELQGNVVKAPLIGTFYSAPAPDKNDFVTVGQKVKKGDVLMIIESMKLMNEIQSDFNGIVKSILVKNGDAVEYDQPIMIIGD